MSDRSTLDPRSQRAAAARADAASSVWVAASAGTGKTKVLTDRVLRLLLAGSRAGAHPLPHLHQGGGRRDGEPPQRAAGALGDGRRRRARAGARGADRRACPDADDARSRAPAVRPRARRAGRHARSRRSTPSASRCCGASRSRPASRRISSVMDERSAGEALAAAREDDARRGARDGALALAEALAEVTRLRRRERLRRAHEPADARARAAAPQPRRRPWRASAPSSARVLDVPPGDDRWRASSPLPAPTAPAMKRRCAARPTPCWRAAASAISERGRRIARLARRRRRRAPPLSTTISARSSPQEGEPCAGHRHQGRWRRSDAERRGARSRAEAERLDAVQAPRARRGVARGDDGAGAARRRACSAPMSGTSEARALLDYDDLIVLKARDLLRRPGVRALGAVQARWRPRPHPDRRGAGHQSRAVGGGRRRWPRNSSPAKARATVPRTVFAVGDAKQSIFSFQRADPRDVRRACASISQRASPAREQRLRASSTLDISFRSTAGGARARSMPCSRAPRRARAWRSTAPRSATSRMPRTAMPGGSSCGRWSSRSDAPTARPWEPPLEQRRASAAAARAWRTRSPRTMRQWLDARRAARGARPARSRPATSWCWCGAATLRRRRWCAR